MKVLKDIIENWGFVDSEQLQELEKFFPKMELIIKWGGMPREACPASEVEERISHVEEIKQDYVREVFIKSESFRQLKQLLGVS
jgi:hypothetical protein